MQVFKASSKSNQLWKGAQEWGNMEMLLLKGHTGAYGIEGASNSFPEKRTVAEVVE